MIRIVVVAMGMASLGLAVLGAVLPLVPMTPFVLLSGLCFSYGSPRLNSWLLASPLFGPVISNWCSHGAIAMPAKRWALATLTLTFLLSLALQVSTMVLIVQGLVLACVGVFIVSRPLPPSS